MPNPVTWFEIMGKDSAGLQRFYRDVFGWKMSVPVAEMGNYSMLEDHEPGIGGGLSDEMGGGNRVSVYVSVDDPQRYLDKAARAGAEVLMPVTTITPDTTIAMFRDPAGNVTGIMKASPRPQQSTARRASSPTRARRSAASGRKKATGRKTSARKKSTTRSARGGRTRRRR